MKNILRKHVLSEYATINKATLVNKITLDTVSVEISDPDEFSLYAIEPTILTKNIEDSDPDEFRMSGTTLETRTIETCDPDEMQMEPPKHTFTVETSDEDEFLFI